MFDNLKKYHIILASNSPRRRELLGGLGLEFEVKVLPNIQEDLTRQKSIMKMYENYLHFIMQDYSSRMSVKEFTLISQTNTVIIYWQTSLTKSLLRSLKTVKYSVGRDAT